MSATDIPKQPKICIIGAGFSGICSAVQLQEKIGNQVNFNIYDENEDFGGTWLINDYPGCGCDIQSQLYSLSFEPNPEWSSNFVSQPEILAYLQRVAKKYNLIPHTQFNVQIRNLQWLDETSLWSVTLYDKTSGTTEVKCYDFIISGVGSLHLPLIPEQFKDFTGQMMHSTKWDYDIDLNDKKVAVIGSGASAVQIIPEIATKVKELHSYQRRPAYVVPRPEVKIPYLIQKLLILIPFLLTIWRHFIFITHEVSHFGLYANSPFNKFATSVIHRKIRKQVKNKITADKLIPNYTFGCKRVMVHSFYYETFNRTNVHIHREPIVKVRDNTLTTSDGLVEEFDVLILATGFKAQEFFAPIEVRGLKNLDVLDYWRHNGPQSYNSIVSSQMPNAFFLLGPNASQNHNSAIFTIECQANFAARMIKHCVQNRFKVFAVKKEAEEKFVKWVNKEMKKMVFVDNCGSWFTNPKTGHVSSIWPKPLISYYITTRKINLNDFVFSRVMM